MNKITLLFPNFKTKALTFSFDDGIDSDIETMELIKKYDVKATFNLCSGHFQYTKDGDVRKPGQLCMPLSENQAKALFADPHAEVASHGQFHPAYANIASSDAIYDMINDRRNLEAMFGKLVRGHVYPYGSVSEDVKQIAKLCGFAYARGVHSRYDFKLPADDEWFDWHPSCHWLDRENLARLTEEFTNSENLYNHGWLFYVWGHTYEFRESSDGFEKFEEFLKKVSFRDDTWYATNIEIYDYINAYRSLVYFADGMGAYNPSQIDVYLRPEYGFKSVLVHAGETVRFDDYKI